MKGKMNEALEELKRVDHLIYVSLKYTRTVDIIQNILTRMVDSYAFIIDALIINAEKNISVEPESALERADIVETVYGSDGLIVDNMRLYLLLRKLLRARHVVRENEYRRHVTMKTIVEGREEIVNIDIITNYYLFQRDFILHVKGIVDGNVEVELTDSASMQPKEPAWMRNEPKEVHEEKEEVSVAHRTPPKRNTLKVRPVGSPPRKRAPRPKKYKIQIPSPDAISLPYQYDPRFRKEIEKEKERIRKEEEMKKRKAKKALLKKSKKAVKKKVSKSKKSKKKVVKKKAKKAVKKKKAKKKVVKKKAPKKVSKSKKKVVKKKTVKKKVSKSKKKSKKTVKRAVKKKVGKVKKALKRFVKKATKR